MQYNEPRHMFTLRETKISKTLQGQQKDIPVQSKQRAEKQNTKKVGCMDDAR